jgi:hypothetical protein
LFATADHIGGTGTYWTYGRIDAAVANAGAPPAPPDPPSGLTASAWPAFDRLEWAASSATDVTYNIYRGAKAGGAKQRIASGVGDTRFGDRVVLVKGESYCYHVTAQGSTRECAPSAEACVRCGPLDEGGRNVRTLPTPVMVPVAPPDRQKARVYGVNVCWKMVAPPCVMVRVAEVTVRLSSVAIQLPFGQPASLASMVSGAVRVALTSTLARPL